MKAYIMPIVLGMDMGIRNLAYCLLNQESDTILAWDNIDILENGISSQISNTCVACGGKAKYISSDSKKWCNGCATGIRRKKSATEKPVFPVFSCALDAKSLRAFAISIGIEDAKHKKKEELLHALSLRYLMPWKQPKAMNTSLTDIRRAMDSWLTTMLPTFAQSSLIRMENQPVLKGPTMKSVQIILFTLLGRRLEAEYNWKGSIEFVHAGTKSAGSLVPQTESEGGAYRARKKNAETDTLAILVKRCPSWVPFFQSRTKKNDLADAFLMAVRK